MSHLRSSLQILFFIANIDKLKKNSAMSIFDFSELGSNYDKIKQKGKGTVFVGMHYSCFELFIQCYSLNFTPPATLARGLGIDSIDNMINSQRELFGMKIFSRKGAYRKILNYIESGKDVCILMDQNVKSSHAEFIDFFGLKVATSKTAFLLKKRLGASLAFASFNCISREISPYQNIILALDAAINNKVLEKPILDVTFKELTGNDIQSDYLELHRQMEKVITKEPESWFWIHRRFKTRPSGEKENLYD